MSADHQQICKGLYTGDVFYVVEEGSCTIYDDDENELARVGKGSCFGELALLRQVRPASPPSQALLFEYATAQAFCMIQVAANV